MSDEAQIYDRFCKDRFEALEKEVKENTAITVDLRAKVINGLTDAVVETKRSVKGVYRLLWALLSAIVLSGIAVIFTRHIP